MHFVGIARGSLAELETLLIIARRLGYIEEPPFRAIIDDLFELSRMTTGLLKSLNERR